MPVAADRGGASTQTFPVLDPEPPPRSRRWWLALTGGCLVLVVTILLGVRVVVAGIAATPGASPAATEARLDLPGRLLVLDYSSGYLAYTDPDGSGFAPMTGASFAGTAGLMSPDDRHVIIGQLQMVDLTDAGVTVHDKALACGVDVGVVPYPWADHVSRVVLLSQSDYGTGAVTTVGLDGGSPHPLGSGATDATADPDRDGALVSVAGSHGVDKGLYIARETSRLEFRWWRARPTVLATTAQLAADAGLHAGRSYTVETAWSPDGALIAATLDELTASASTAVHALVVVDRSGRLVHAAKSTTPVEPIWSHDSTQLAHLTAQGLVVLRLAGAAPTVRTISLSVPPGSRLFYAPTDGDVLCGDPETGAWTIADVGSGRVMTGSTTPRRYPLAWLPDREGAGG